MSQRFRKIGFIVLLAISALTVTGLGQSSTPLDVRELASITESFRQLAMWDAAAAGDVWMNEQSVETWTRFIDTALPNQTAMISLFTHAIVLGDVAVDGTPIACLLNPWTGTIVIMAFGGDHGSVSGVAIEIVADSLSETQGAQLIALTLMEAIAHASDRLDTYLEQPWPSLTSEADGSRITERLVTRSAQLRLAYPAEGVADEALSLARETRLAIQLGNFTDLLTVIEDADPSWIQSLIPVHAEKTGDSFVLILGSNVDPLDLVQLTISDGTLQEVAWIRLFDRVITRTEEES